MENVLGWSQITPQQLSIFNDNRPMAKMSLRKQGMSQELKTQLNCH